MENNYEKLLLKSLDADDSIYKKVALLELEGKKEDAKYIRDSYLAYTFGGPAFPMVFDIYVKIEKGIILKRKKQECSCKINKSKEKTIKEVFDEMTEEQKTVVYFLVGAALEDAKNEKSNGEGVKKYTKKIFYDIVKKSFILKGDKKWISKK